MDSQLVENGSNLTDGFVPDYVLPRLLADSAPLAEKLVGVKGVIIDMNTVQTNIVIFRTGAGAPDAATVAAKAKEQGVLGQYLDTVLTRAFNVAKRVRTETTIGESAVSVSFAAVELAR